MCSARLAPNTVPVPNQAADLQRRKAIKIGAYLGHLTLNCRMQGGQILFRLDEVGNAREDKTGGVLERIIFKLPDAVHENVAGTQGSADQSACAAVILHLDRL